MSNYYLGQSPELILGDTPRYFYALRRNSDGSLYFIKNDNIKDKESIDINNPGDLAENFTDFETGVDFYEGVNVNHQQVFENLKYPQYRWDNRSVLYYVNAEGELVARVNQGYTYPTGLSE